jgi:hypothetical protein
MKESIDAVKVSGPDEDDINANTLVEDDNSESNLKSE